MNKSEYLIGQAIEILSLVEDSSKAIKSFVEQLDERKKTINDLMNTEAFTNSVNRIFTGLTSVCSDFRGKELTGEEKKYLKELEKYRQAYFWLNYDNTLPKTLGARVLYFTKKEDADTAFQNYMLHNTSKLGCFYKEILKEKDFKEKIKKSFVVQKLTYELKDYELVIYKIEL